MSDTSPANTEKPTATAETAVELIGITKRFGAFVANENVNLTVKRGEIHAIIGENGAGKTTLMNILFGLLQPDEGKIKLNGKEIVVTDPAMAIDAGLGMVHQHFKLVPSLSVAENVFLGMEIRRNGLIDHTAQIDRTRELSERFGLKVEPEERVSLLSVGIEQRIEILKVLARGARTIILDEPTAVLTPQESRELFQTLRGFVAGGMTVIFISHHLEEVMEVSDTVTVLRHGKHVATRPTAELTKADLVRMMVGRDVSFDRRPRGKTDGQVVLEVRNLWARDDRRLPALRDANFTVRAGEIVGIAGLMGAGRTELAKSIFGRAYGKKITGQAFLHGKEVDLSTIEKAIDKGIAYVTEDRKGDGLVLEEDIKKNISLANLGGVSERTVIDEAREYKIAADFKQQMRIRCSSVLQKVVNLSGGNQQKVVLSKWLFSQPEVLILDEPTRGIDVGAKFEIYNIISKLAAEGKCIIMISSEMPELLGMCDRIYVMNEGQFVGHLPKAEATQESIMRAIMRNKRIDDPGLSQAA